jgi:cobalt-zinc-cadmium efflux system outer membrane protein
MLVLFSLLAALAASAASSCGERAQALPELLLCAEKEAPVIKAAELGLEQAFKEEGARGQWRNPELSADSFHGSVGGADQSETNIALGIPLEFGKVGARRSVGVSIRARAEAELYAAQAELRATLLLNLHRFRQARHELEVVEESIASFSKLVGQYGSRPRRSPEQETSAAVYRMAKSEYELKKAALADELAELDAFFLLNLGVRGPALNRLLPRSPSTWPAIGEAPALGSSPRARGLAAGVKNAEAELALARSEAWPTVSIGPSVRFQSQGSARGTLYGFNVGLALPVFNANGAGKQAAAAAFSTRAKGQDLGLAAEARARELAVGIYGRSTALLKTTLSHGEIERAHREIERLFSRGVVPSPLVIEAHRAYLELERARNERERKAIAALLEVYTIDGLIMEKIL